MIKLIFPSVIWTGDRIRRKNKVILALLDQLWWISFKWNLSKLDSSYNERFKRRLLILSSVFKHYQKLNCFPADNVRSSSHDILLKLFAEIILSIASLLRLVTANKVSFFFASPRRIVRRVGRSITHSTQYISHIWQHHREISTLLGHSYISRCLNVAWMSTSVSWGFSREFVVTHVVSLWFLHAVIVFRLIVS